MGIKEKYIVDGNAITQIICSVLGVLLIFVSWLTLSANGHLGITTVPSVYERLQGSGGPGAYIFIGACLLNVVLKFFSRSSWLSVFCAFFLGGMVFQEFQAMREINSSNLYKAMGASCNISIGGVIAIIVEIVFIVSTLIGIIQWLANCTRRTAKKMFVASFVGLILLALGFYLMLKGTNADDNITLVISSILTSIGFFMVIVCTLFGLIIWLRNKKEPNSEEEVAIDDNKETVRDNSSKNEADVKSIVNDYKDTKSKWYYILGSFILVSLVAGGIYTLGNKGKASGEFSGKPISELFPAIVKTSDSGAIPDAPAIYQWDVSQGEECSGDVTVVRKADENQMVVMYETNSCDANILRLGIYQNGQYVFYYELLVGNIDYDETKNGISLHADLPESTIYYGYYGKDVAKTVEQEWGTEHSIDWNNVSEAQLAELFQNVLKDGPKASPYILTYNEIKANMGGAAISDNEEEKELTGFSFLVGNAEFGLDLYADVDGNKVPTGISGTAQTLDIFHQYDFDGNGEKEALVYEWGGGNTAYPPYIVYYDKESKTFKKAEGFETTFGEQDAEYEMWEGKLSILVKSGLETARYVFNNHEIKKVESKVPDVGPQLATFTCKQLFGGSSEMEQTVCLDLNNDGADEKLIFTSNSSQAFDDGNAMMLEKIIWSTGTETFGCHQVSDSFTFLQSMTNGAHDMITNGRQLQKWSGEEYKENIYN